MTNLRLALLEPEDEVLTEDTTDRGDMQDVRPLRELNNNKNNLTVKEYKCCLSDLKAVMWIRIRRGSPLWETTWIRNQEEKIAEKY